MASGIIDKYKNEPATILTNPLNAPLFEDLPNLENLIVMHKKPWEKHWIEAWGQTVGRRWNRIVNFRKAGLPYFLSARKRYTWRDTPSAPEHIVCQVSKCLGFTPALSPTLWLSEDRLRRTRPTRPTLAVAPIPGWKGKQWPLENFIELLQCFCKTYPEAHVAVFSAPSEIPLVDPLLRALPEGQWIDVRGWPLLDCVALIKASPLFLGNDSGLMHMSAAVGTPTLALFGPSNEKIYGPWSSQTPSPHRVLRGDPFTMGIRQVKETESQCYMTSLGVPPVWNTLREMWTLHTY